MVRTRYLRFARFLRIIDGRRHFAATLFLPRQKCTPTFGGRARAVSVLESCPVGFRNHIRQRSAFVIVLNYYK